MPEEPESSTRPPRVSVVIPAWNDSEVLPACLESVLASSYQELEVIVVDNASQDETPTLVAEWYPSVRLVRNPENLGFGGAIAQGTQLSTGKYVLWLNADAVLDPDWIRILVRAFESNPRLGMATSVVVYDEPKNVIWSAGGWIDATTGFTWDHAKGQRFSEAEPARSPDYASGCALMVRSEAFVAAGGLDTGYFVYFEDADLSFRMKAAGYRIEVLPAPAVLHRALRQSGIRGMAPEKLYLFARSNLRFILKNWPLYRMISAVCAWLALYFGFAIVKGSASHIPSVLRAVQWNLQHLEETRAERARNRLATVPTSRLGQLWSFAVRIAQAPELYPY